METGNLLVPSNIPGLGYRLARNHPTAPFQTDEIGFRRRPNTEIRPKWPVLLLGDSVAFGGGVRYQDTFASLVEEQLSRALRDQVAVYNAGTPGYNTVQEALLLKDIRKSVKSDLIILQFCMNDHLDAVTLTADNTLDATTSAAGQVSLRSLIYRSRALFFLKEEIKNIQKMYPERFPVALHYIHHIQKHPGWQRAKNAIAEIADTAKEMNSRLLLVIFPVEQQLRIGDRTPQEDLVAFARSRGIAVLDLYATFARHCRENLFFDYSIEQHVVDKLHLSKRGHELSASDIAAAILRDQGLRSAFQ
jgi:lysophospholipase L1-like esterase